jgi:hypothetical protein
MLFYVAVNMEEGNEFIKKEFLKEEDAEYLVTTAAMRGDDWLEARNIVDLEIIANLADQCLNYSDNRYEEYVTQVTAENNDRADLQEKSLDRHLETQKAKLEQVREKHLAEGRASLATATSAKIKALEERVQMKKTKINECRVMRARKDDVCVGVINVTGG